MAMRSLVFPPSSSMGVPAFFRDAPSFAANSLYSFSVRPRDWSAASDQASIWSALSLKTVWTPPMDCSRSAAPEIAYLPRSSASDRPK